MFFYIFKEENGKNIANKLNYTKNFIKSWFILPQKYV